MLFDNDTDAADQYPYMHAYTNYIKKMTRPLVGRQHEKEQVMAAMMKPEYCNVLLLGEAGSGKAQPLDTWIPVADERGYVLLRDIKVGDFVFNENGEPVEVIGVFPQGMKEAYEVGFTDGTRTQCCDEHLWSARRRSTHHKNGPYSVHTLRDMIDQDITRIGKKAGRKGMLKYMWYVPRNKAVQRPDVELPMDPYALGALIGDGALTDDPLVLSSDDEYVVAKVAKNIGAAGYKKSEYNHSWFFLVDEGQRGNVRSDTVYIQSREFAAKPGLDAAFGRKSIARRIPEQYLNGSVAQRMDLLHGLMDTDGCVSGEGGRINVKFSTNSEMLAEDMRRLAASLGYRTNVSSRDREDDVHVNREYSVYFMVSDEEAEKLFTLPRQVEKIRSRQGRKKKFHHCYDDIAIEYVKDLGYKTEMACIYVDCPSHLYQTGREHIVTHNTALVQGIMVMDTERMYLEVDLSKMIANLKNENEMADRLKTLFDEVSRFRREKDREIVLFIDEFHQIVQLSPAAVEVLKPLLADSGTRGIRVIAATTHVEYQQFIAPNLPLVERLQRIKLVQPGEDVVVSILQSMCDRYGAQPASPELFSEIYEYTNRYIPSTSQPRKSILILDSMIGWHRLTHKPLDRKLLADVIYETEGINVAFRVDAATIKKKLDEKVLAQQVATSSIEQRLQICVAGLNNQNRPMSSFLFAGSTGVGKQVFDYVPIPVYTEDGSLHHKLNGELKVGDIVFDRTGAPTTITGVYPQGLQDVYEVELTDGRKLPVGREHLWTYKSRFGNGSKYWKVATTGELMEKNANKYYNKGRTAANVKFVIPMNQAVQWPAQDYRTDPYVIGALLGNGCLTFSILSFSSNDEETVSKIAKLIGAHGYFKHATSYTWNFIESEAEDSRIPMASVLRDVPELVDKRSHEKFIPEIYKYGSVEQRWALIQGLFDTDGTIDDSTGRYNVSYSSVSEQLVLDIQDVLYSLGIASSISNHGTRGRSGNVHDEFDLHVKVGNADKHKFFSLTRKLEKAKAAALSDAGKKRVKKFDEVVGIRDIRKLDKQAHATCIMVDNDEHLYQAGQYIVTHNTEATKQLANILYDDDRNLIRFDMTEFALPDSLNRFRRELTNRVSTIPYCLILFDEIEKACGPVTRVLLQVLDDGRLLDENEREVTFKNAYIIVTTNSGSEIFRNISNYEQSDKADLKVLEKYDKLLREAIKSQSGSKFPPELLGRIDCIVPFQPLSKATMAGIIQMKLKGLARTVKQKHGVTIHVHKDIYPYMLYDKLDTDADSGGARIVVSKLEREVTVPLARYINEHPGQKEIYISIGGDMAVANKRQLESMAYVHVGTEFLPSKLSDGNDIEGIDNTAMA